MSKPANYATTTPSSQRLASPQARLMVEKNLLTRALERYTSADPGDRTSDRIVEAAWRVFAYGHWGQPHQRTRASCRLPDGEAATMTTYYAEIVFSVVSFETDPSDDVNADAKIWTPQNEAWVDCLGSSGIGADVRWGNDYREIPESAVPEMQQRCREFMHKGDGRPQQKTQGQASSGHRKALTDSTPNRETRCSAN